MAERAFKPVDERAKWQAGTIDPGMESAKAEAVAGEGKAVASERFSFGKISCGVPESVETVTEKKVIAELTGKGARRSETRCLVRRHARGKQLEIGSLGTTPCRVTPRPL